MTDGEALHAAVRANPTEPTVHAAYSDWHEENGDPLTARTHRLIYHWLRSDPEKVFRKAPVPEQQIAHETLFNMLVGAGDLSETAGWYRRNLLSLNQGRKTQILTFEDVLRAVVKAKDATHGWAAVGAKGRRYETNTYRPWRPAALAARRSDGSIRVQMDLVNPLIRPGDPSSFLHTVFPNRNFQEWANRG